MAKGEEKKKTMTAVDTDRNRLQEEHDEFNSVYKDRNDQAYKMGEAERGEIWKGLQDYRTGLGSGPGGGGGGYSLPSTYDEAKNIYRMFGQDGGQWDPRIRGTYGNFAETGGLSEGDKTNIRSRATSGIPAMYQTMQDDLTRRASARGQNNSLAFNAGMARAARESSRGVSQAALEAETGIIDRVNQGKLAGAGGLLGLDTNVNQNRLAGAQGLESIAGAEAQHAASSAAASRDAASDHDARQRWALGSMMDMYGASPGEAARYDNLMLAERDMNNQYMSGNIGQRANLTGRGGGGWGSKLAAGAKIAGGVGLMMTGAGAAAGVPLLASGAGDLANSFGGGGGGGVSSAINTGAGIWNAYRNNSQQGIAPTDSGAGLEFNGQPVNPAGVGGYRSNPYEQLNSWRS